MKNVLKLLGSIVFTAVITLSITVCGGGDSDNPNNPNNPNNLKVIWLQKNIINYTVTDGVAGAVSSETEYNWVRYNSDKDFEYVTERPREINTVQITENASYRRETRRTGVVENTTTLTRNNNIQTQSTRIFSDITQVVETDYVSESTQDTITTTRTIEEEENEYTWHYDSVSGLNSRIIYNGSTKTTQNDNAPFYSTSSTDYSYSIDLLEESDGEQTFKSQMNRAIVNGNESDVSSQGFSIYKIKDGITLEQTSYNAEGDVTQITERAFPENNIIRSRLPNYTLSTTTSYRNNTVQTQSVEVLSETSTMFVLRFKTFTDGVLTSQADYQYEIWK